MASLSYGLATLNMKYIPFGLQRSDEQTFGRLLHKNLDKQQKTRNMTIFGVNPILMVYGRLAVVGVFPDQYTLWDQLYSSQGLLQVDTHMGTANIGKWHLLVIGESYDEIAKSVDAILENITKVIPTSVHKIINNFLHP